jgi:hypothetical protein
MHQCVPSFVAERGIPRCRSGPYERRSHLGMLTPRLPKIGTFPIASTALYARRKRDTMDMSTGEGVGNCPPAIVTNADKKGPPVIRVEEVMPCTCVGFLG